MKHSQKPPWGNVPRRSRSYRPRLETLEDRLPPGDTVLGGLLAWWWAAPVPLGVVVSPQDSGFLAPEGRPSEAGGVSPWEAVEQSFGEPRRVDRAVARSEFLSPFQGSEGQGLSDSQGWRPGLPTVAPPGLADELTDGTVSNPVRPQRAAMPLSAADLHASYRPADAGNGFTGQTPTQPFWVAPAVAAAGATRQEVRLPALAVESVADTESPPAGREGPHLGLHQAGSVALVRGGPGVAGPQECPTGNPPLPDGTTCFAGQDKNGAYYLIAIPENWNGAVVLYAHGGPSFTPPVPLTADSLVAREALLPQGIAMAATSYRAGGYHVSQDAEDVENLRQLFVEVVGPPTRTVVFGISYGGPVAAKVAELYAVNPDGSHNYDGAVIGAGVLAGYRRAFYERLDLRVVYQHYCHNHPYPDELQYPLWQGLSPGTEMTTDELTRRINECTAVQLPPEERTPQQQENLTNILNVIRIPEASLIGNLVTGTITLGDITQHFLNGRNAFPNRDVRYDGSMDDRELNRGITREGYRYYSDRSAVAALDTDSQPTGRVEIPVVTIHAINDTMAFVENEAAYRETLTRAGRLHLLFQTFVNRAGHPGLILAEYGAALDAVFNWIETGDRPTQEGVITSCAQYQKWLGGTCQIDPKYQPGPLESRIYPRRP